jgi:hypothetical protein
VHFSPSEVELLPCSLSDLENLFSGARKMSSCKINRKCQPKAASNQGWHTGKHTYCGFSEGRTILRVPAGMCMCHAVKQDIDIAFDDSGNMTGVAPVGAQYTDVTPLQSGDQVTFTV